MRTLRATTVAAICGLSITTAWAQGPLTQPGFVAGGPAAVAGVAHALDQQSIGGQGAFVNAHGDPFVLPANYCGPCGPGGGMGGMGGGNPYGGASMNTEQCGPHYFDFSLEYLHYFREDAAFSDSTVYSTLGFPSDNNTVIDPSGLFFGDPNNVLLTGGDLSSEDGNGWRITGRMDVGALSFVEFAYSGVYWDDAAQVNQLTSTGLFSPFSLWGTATNGNFDADGTAGAPSGTDFLATDNAQQHTLDYESQLHSVEASYRRYWVGANPRISGTMLIGFRYTNLQEEFGFSSIGSADDRLALLTDSKNDLAGVQIGGDAWMSIVQGFRLGGEVKVGLYNNDYRVQNVVASSAGGPNFQETVVEDDQAAFMLEAKLMGVVDLTPSWSLKAGYEILFMSQLALVGDGAALAQPYGDINNISQLGPTASPAGTFPSVQPTSSGDILFHGFTVGAEYVW